MLLQFRSKRKELMKKESFAEFDKMRRISAIDEAKARQIYAVLRSHINICVRAYTNMGIIHWPARE